jgi:hypothetical protein
MEVNTHFDPRTSGFEFTNRFPGGHVLSELVRQERLSELTGLKLPRVLRQLSDLAAGENFWGTFGLCGGMSWAALDRFQRDEPPPVGRSIPGSDDELFRELVGRQADSMRGRKLMERCIVWQVLPDKAPWWMIWSKGVGRLTVDQEWPRLRTALDAGNPSSLVLIRAQGVANPSAHHQVVAIGYEISDSGAVEIRLYDPNHPHSRPTVPIDPSSQSAGPLQSTGEPFRGFFVWSPS